MSTPSNEPSHPGAEPEEPPVTGHEYDGIAEYDNPLPRWWTRLFWLTFVFSLGYYVHYQLTGKGQTVVENYDQDMREFREMLASQALGEEITEEGLAQLMSDPAMVKDGGAVYQARCVQCHADRGQGNIGPNLTDDYWMYGSGTLMDIYTTVVEGRTTKGMPAWGRMLRPMELGAVAAFVGSLRGSNVAGKEPQGKLVTAAERAAPSDVKTGASADTEGANTEPTEAEAQSAPALPSPNTTAPAKLELEN